VLCVYNVCVLLYVYVTVSVYARVYCINSLMKDVVAVIFFNDCNCDCSRDKDCACRLTVY
jgi:hypothetical protein